MKAIWVWTVIVCNALMVTGMVTTYKCTNRFEFRETIKEYILAYKNCTFIHERFPACKQNVTVAITVDPPYTVKGEDGNAAGIIPGILQLIMQTCCFGCSNITFEFYEGEIMKYFSNSSLIMPHEGAMKSSEYNEMDYIPFIEVKGVTFLAKMTRSQANQLSLHMLKAIGNTWPLFLTAFLMAIIAGCVIWVLDMWFNTDEFPTQFPRGPFEGFWWAFVSMTTVGYGDRSPKSTVARLFAIVWILAGITIFSMYTATLTSALTSEVELSKVDGMFGKKVGVLFHTAAGHSAAVQENAEVLVFHNISALIEALDNDEIYAIALDDNIAGFYLNLMKSKIKDLKQHHRLAIEGNSFGVLSRDKNLAVFLKTFYEANDDNRNTIIAKARHDHSVLLNKPDENENAGVDSFFSASSPLFLTTMLVLIFSGICTIIIGLTCKCFFKRNKKYLDKYVSFQLCGKKNKNKKKEVEMQMISKSPSGLETKFVEELDAFKNKWLLLLRNNTES